MALRHPNGQKWQGFMAGNPGRQAVGYRTHRFTMVTTFAYANSLYCMTQSSDDFETHWVFFLDEIPIISFCRYPISMQFCCVVFAADC
ncbi:hypothetical protein TNCV_3957021 [Trichonephila clavipes]|nr:hypothetical protein TNCV_3957021 [Trichonephila clavipes]